jgi:hypothetical protein
MILFPPGLPGRHLCHLGAGHQYNDHYLLYLTFGQEQKLHKIHARQAAAQGLAPGSHVIFFTLFACPYRIGLKESIACRRIQ